MKHMVKVACCLATVAGLGFGVLAADDVVYHAQATVAIEGDGQSWASPMSLTNALASAAATGGEVWLKGDVVLTCDVPTLSPSGGSVTVRGGFAGTEASPEERAAGLKSTIDGQDLYKTLVVTCSKAVTLERLVLTRSIAQGLYKTGNSAFTVRDCEMTCNGRINYTAGINGRGAYVASGDNTFTNCVIAKNWGETQVNYIGTAGLHVSKATRVTLDDCLFERNGYVGVGRWSACSTLYAEETPIAMRNTVFRGNRATVDNGNAVIKLDKRGDKSVISNCLFVANEECGSGGVGIFDVAFQNGAWGGHNHHVDFCNCTFAYNVSRVAGSATALTIAHGIVTVKNCIFYGNLAGSGSSSGVDISVTGSDGNCTVSYSLFGGTPETKSQRFNAVAGTLTEGAGVVFGDPFFVSSLADFRPLLTVPDTTFPKSASASPALVSFMKDDEQFAKLKALDVHLLSSAGYFANDGTEHRAPEGTISDAIDKGDPEMSFGAEPEPNGGKINCGVYGGTAQASKTATSQVAVESVFVSFPTNEAQPRVTFTLGGSGAYSATGVVKVYADGALAYTFAPIDGLRLGTTKELWVPQYFEPGTRVTATVTLSTTTSGDEKTSEEIEATGTVPVWAGKGGDPAKVIHVRPGARGGDGTSWTSAFADLPSAVGAVGGGRNEIWVPVDLGTTNAASFNLLPGSAVTIRGGFSGAENAAEDRAAGLRTVLDGKYETRPMTVVCNASVTFERFVFKRSATSGLHKTGSASFTVRDCEFLENGHRGYAAGVDGRALHIESGNNYVTNCLIARNWGEKTVDNIGAAGISAKEGTAIFVDGTTFEQNGYVGVGRWNPGYALYVYNMRMVVRNCVFRGNRVAADYGSGMLYQFLGNNGNNSEISDSLFIGNEHLGVGTGLLSFNSNWQPSSKVKITGCTFAYNLNHPTTGATALQLGEGVYTVKDCIFWGNLAGNKSTSGVDISLTSASGSCDLSYSLFGGTPETKTNYYNAVAGTIAEGAGIVFGDPAFVSKLDAFRNILSTNGLNGAKMTFPRAQIENPTFREMVTNETFFAEIKKLNAHLRGGRYIDETTGASLHYSGVSAAIDVASPERDWSKEPKPNGKRANLGYYGGTPWATSSKLGGMLIVR